MVDEVKSVFGLGELFTRSQEPMLVLKNGKVVHSNDAALSFLGCEDTECLDKYFSDYFENAVDAGSQRSEIIFEHPTLDKPIPIEAIFTELNTSETIHVTLRDVSDVETLKQQLKKSQELTKLAQNAKKTFFASMSIELKTPLNVILGFSELLKAQYLGKLGNDQYYEYVKDIHSSGVHMLELVNDLLELSSVELQQRPLTKSFFHLPDVVKSSIRTVEKKAKQKDIQISTSLIAEKHNIYAHKRGIKQILENLLTNSVKYTPPVGSISVDTVIENNIMTITVEDNGIGIKESKLPSIIEPFTHVNNHDYMANYGVGLGLAVCKNLIDAYGGEMTIESTENVGTKVKFTVPVKYDDSEKSSNQNIIEAGKQFMSSARS